MSGTHIASDIARTAAKNAVNPGVIAMAVASLVEVVVGLGDVDTAEEAPLISEKVAVVDNAVLTPGSLAVEVDSTTDRLFAVPVEITVPERPVDVVIGVVVCAVEVPTVVPGAVEVEGSVEVVPELEDEEPLMVNLGEMFPESPSTVGVESQSC